MKNDWYGSPECEPDRQPFFFTYQALVICLIGGFSDEHPTIKRG